MRSGATDRWWSGVRGLLPLTAAALLAVGPLPTPASADDRADAALVFCLSADQRPHLVEAAVVLGLTHPGSAPDRLTTNGQDRSIEQWRSGHRADFDRACAALIGAQRHETGSSTEQSNGLFALLVPALLSGAVGWFFSAQLATAGARRVQADGLRTASRAFVDAGEAFLRQQQTAQAGLPPDDETVHTRRVELAAALDQVASARRWWRMPQRLSETLSGTPLGPAMTEDWFPLDTADRASRATALRSALGRFAAEVEQVARAVQSSGLPRTRMWRR
ncbi:hypothetical protein ACWDV4_10490 [Micromonospora sp. NPDC003197]